MKLPCFKCTHNLSTKNSGSYIRKLVQRNMHRNNASEKSNTTIYRIEKKPDEIIVKQIPVLKIGEGGCLTINLKSFILY